MERLREAGRPRTGWTGWTVGRGSAGRLELPAGPDRLAQSDWQDRMAKMGKEGLPARGDFPERLAPKGWSGLPALTVGTEMRVKLAHRGLAGQSAQQAQQDQLARSDFQDRTVKMVKMDHQGQGGFRGSLVPRDWPVPLALTVMTEMKARLAHRGLAVFKVRLALRGQTVVRESPAQTDLMGKTDGQVRWGRPALLARQDERGRPVWTAWTAMAGTEDTSRHQRLALGFWPLRRRTANF